MRREETTYGMVPDLMATGWTGCGICGQILGSEIGPRQHPTNLVVGLWTWILENERGGWEGPKSARVDEGAGAGQIPECTCRLDASTEPQIHKSKNALRHMVQFLYSVHAGVRVMRCMRVREGLAMTSPTLWRRQNRRHGASKIKALHFPDLEESKRSERAE